VSSVSSVISVLTVCGSLERTYIIFVSTPRPLWSACSFQIFRVPRTQQWTSTLTDVLFFGQLLMWARILQLLFTISKLIFYSCYFNCTYCIEKRNDEGDRLTASRTIQVLLSSTIQYSTDLPVVVYSNRPPSPSVDRESNQTPSLAACCKKSYCSGTNNTEEAIRRQSINVVLVVPVILLRAWSWKLHPLINCVVINSDWQR
jgi:hypothetical protein